MSRRWTVPVNGQLQSIDEVPEAEFDLCAKCRSPIGESTHRGRKKITKQSAGVGEDGKLKIGQTAGSESRYYCSPRCLENDGAVEDGVVF